MARQCSHSGCTCGVAESKKYCSDQCRSMSAHKPELRKRCNCGHPGCAN